MASSEWGGFEWGAGEWGGVEDAGAAAELAGSATLTLSASASLSIGQRLAGAGLLTLQAAAALAIGVTLSGAASLTLSASAALAQPVPGAQLAGHATMTLSARAALDVGLRELRPRLLSIETSLQSSCAQWEAELPGSREYLAIHNDRTVDIGIGFRRSVGSPLVFVGIKQGIVDEYRLECRKPGNISHLKGRDAAGALFDREFNTLYQRYPGQDVQVPDGTAVLVGIFRARTVAETIIASMGLTPAWQCRDYELWEDFDATGRAIDILRRLVDPWCSVEPSRVDIWCEGTTVYLRQRTPFPLAADHRVQYDQREAASSPVRRIRALDLNIRTTRLPIYGDVQLTGREEVGETPASVDGADYSSHNVEIIPFQRDVDENGAVSFTPGRVTQRSTSRSLYGRVEIQSTYQIPNQVLLETRKNTYVFLDGGGEKQAKREVKGTDYQPFTYDARGATNSPMPTRDFSSVGRFVDEELPNGVTATVFKQDTEETTDYVYDKDNFLVTATTTQKQAKDGVLVPTTQVVKHYQDTGPLSYTVNTDRYVFEVESGFESQFGQIFGGEFSGETGTILVPVDRLVPKWVSGDSTPANGHRPGGPNRPATKPMTSEFSGLIGAGISDGGRISSDPKAQNVSRTIGNMSAADLAFINAQHAEASGLYENELELTILSMPWLKVGDLIEILGVKDDFGDPIDFGKALVYGLEAEIEFAPPRSHMRVKAVSWQPAPED